MLREMSLEFFLYRIYNKNFSKDTASVAAVNVKWQEE